jgi:hypothetical protein
MVGRRLLTATAGLLFLLWAGVPAAQAELESSVRILAVGTLTHDGSEPLVLGGGEAGLTVKSTGSREVRGLLQINALLGNGYSLEIPRAYIKARFPGFRTTVGRTRVSWGRGFFFNAGDVIFEGLDLEVRDLSAAELRDRTDWLAELYLPLGQFSYFEALVLPYSGSSPGLVIDPLDPVEGLAAPGKVAGGGRLAFKLGGISAEAGYLYHGESDTHRPYLSLQGHLLADLYAAASWHLPASGARSGDLDEYTALSAGLFRLVNLSAGGSLGLRLEAGIRPGAHWAALDSAPPEGETGYGLYLFPELSFAPRDNLTLQLRSLVSPVDGSALILGSVSWNVYQGLTVLATLGGKAGEEGDTYDWHGWGGAAFSTGLEYIY